MSGYPDARFLTSANRPDQFVTDQGAEVAFAGRSNAGKSSAINAIVNRRQLARTSKTPGRTQLVNFFHLAPGERLVDLPGYGFARVPAGTQEHWRRLLETYFETRRSLRGLFPLGGHSPHARASSTCRCSPGARRSTARFTSCSPRPTSSVAARPPRRWPPRARQLALDVVGAIVFRADRRRRGPAHARACARCWVPGRSFGIVRASRIRWALAGQITANLRPGTIRR